MDALSTSYTLLSSPHGADFAKEKRECLTKLTSLIDQGRWLLPNHEHVSYGKDKESAYTGFRQAPLDDLVSVYDVLWLATNEGDLSVAAETSMKAKRRFASAIQEKLEPRVVEIDLRKLGDGIS